MVPHIRRIWVFFHIFQFITKCVAIGAMYRFIRRELGRLSKIGSAEPLCRAAVHADIGAGCVTGQVAADEGNRCAVFFRLAETAGGQSAFAGGELFFGGHAT